MATRFYTFPPPASGVVFLVPSFTKDASWGGQGSGYYSGFLMHKRWLSTGYLWDVWDTESSAVNPFDACCAQFVSAPLEAQAISGTIKGVFLVRELAATDDLRAQLVVRVIGPDGTVRGTLLGMDTSALTSEFSTTYTNRKFPLAWTGAGATLTSVTALLGDRIVAEIGMRAHNSSGSAVNALFRLGVKATGDCAEDETGTTDLTGWLELSQTLNFAQDGGLAAYHGSMEDLVSQVGSPRAGDPPNGRYATRSVSKRELVTTDRACTRRPGFGLATDSGAGFISPGGGAVTKYKMRAQDSGVAAPGYVTWVALTPDFAGLGYSAGTPTPVGSMVVGSAIVAASFEE